MKHLIFLLTVMISFSAFADERPEETIKASNFFLNKTKITNYSDESFSSSNEIDFQGNQINKVIVNDVDNPLIRYIGTPLANLGLAALNSHRETYEIFLYIDGGTEKNCYITFEKDADPKLSRCK